jgi:NADH-quinone oxidoreductase subunit L
VAWFFYLKRPDIPAAIQRRFGPIYRLLENKYYFDNVYECIFAGGSRLLGRCLWVGGDQGLIDGVLVNGSARVVGWIGRMSRSLQSGLVYQYAFWVVLGVLVSLTLFVPTNFGLRVIRLLEHIWTLSGTLQSFVNLS